MDGDFNEKKVLRIRVGNATGRPSGTAERAGLEVENLDLKLSPTHSSMCDTIKRQRLSFSFLICRMGTAACTSQGWCDERQPARSGSSGSGR